MSTNIITIRDIEKPLKPDMVQDILWVCKSFGFVSSRDIEETAGKIFHSIILATHEGKELTSEAIAEKSDVTRGTALFHLKDYIDSGLVIQKKTKYTLRRRSISGTIEEIEVDAQKMLNNIKIIARELDARLKLYERS